jgi:hypothetical protein
MLDIALDAIRANARSNIGNEPDAERAERALEPVRWRADEW